MVHTDLYKINLKSLSDGQHEFVYELGDAYFADIDSEVSSGEVSARVVCTKHGDLHQLQISIEGYVVVQCDRCLDEVEYDVVSDRQLVVKFGSEYMEESDELLIVPEREGVLDLHWLLYEDVVLSLPLQRFHLEGECSEEMMRLYGDLSTEVEPQADGVARDEEGVDQRWSALKRLREN